MEGFKKEVVQLLQNTIDMRRGELEAEVQQLKEALLSDTKSTAGDKYETGRAMTHLELEKLSGRLNQIIQQQQTLKRIDFSSPSVNIRMGSLVKTNKGYYLIAIAFGSLSIMDKDCFVLSPASPLGNLLLGKQRGNQLQLNNETIQIDDTY